MKTIAPIIISASRATDIPAFYSRWFFNQLEKGYVKWINPFNKNNSLIISFENLRLIVFWSKNPVPILPYLKILEEKKIYYYFQYTLNDYQKEGLEPDLPDLSLRIKAFKDLSEKIGKEKVIWRFDPLILLNDNYIENLLEKISNLANQLINYTNKLVISFVDILPYKRVQLNFLRFNSQIYNEKNIQNLKNFQNLKNIQNFENIKNLKNIQNFENIKNLKIQNLEIQNLEFSNNQKIEFAKRLSVLIKQLKTINPSFEVSTCAENIDLDKYEITHNKCIDDNLIKKLFSEDDILMNFIASKKNLKDKGQRKDCLCILSKDIGSYNTCKYHCVYCYANNYILEK